MVPYYVGIVAAAVLRKVFPKQVEKAGDVASTVFDATETAVTATVGAVKATVEATREAKERIADSRETFATFWEGCEEKGRPARRSAPDPEAEDPMDATHGSIPLGAPASEVSSRMGEPSSVDVCGQRELWNFSDGLRPARWQVLFEAGKVIGLYVRGTYRFAQQS